MSRGTDAAVAGDDAVDADALLSPAPEVLARNRYYDRERGTNAVKLNPGEYFATRNDLLLVTVLGSCVAACIRDPFSGIGGMNHFMLPDSDSPGPASRAARYGVYAMEVLVGHLMKLGALRQNLEAKLFGGGNVLAGMTQSNIGHKNAEFVVAYLREEGIRVIAADLASNCARKVYYYPKSGRTLVNYLGVLPNATLLERESRYEKRLGGLGGGFESFDRS